MPEISKYAVVERGAKIAENVRIGPFCYVGPRVRIENGCVIDSSVTLTGRTTFGERNHILPLSVLGGGPDGEEGELVIGEANVIREYVTIYGGKESATRIGRDNLIMIGCQIDPGANIGDHGVFANNMCLGAGSKIEDYVRTSAFVQVDSGRTVGAYTFMLAFAHIDRDCPPFAMVQGAPMRVRGVNAENLHRCGFGDDTIREIKSAFRELYDGTGREVDPAVLSRLLAEDKEHLKRLALAVQAGLERGTTA